jgi:hypothetical protein
MFPLSLYHTQSARTYHFRREFRNFNEIKRRAKVMGVNTYGMKKTEVIRYIQRAENPTSCSWKRCLNQ